MAKKRRRVSVTLTDEEHEQLKFVADRLGFSKAAVASGMISNGLPLIFAMVEASVPRTKKEKPETTLKRVRGVSAEQLGEVLKDVMQQ